MNIKMRGKEAMTKKKEQKKTTNNKKIIKNAIRIIFKFMPIKWMSRKGLFEIWEEKGVHITPVHFYEPIPYTKEIKEEDWKRKPLKEYMLFNKKAEERINKMVKKYEKELKENEISKGQSSFEHKKILYSIIRGTKPKRIIEIGSGATTEVMIKANKHKGKLTSIDPYGKKRKGVKMVKKKLEDYEGKIEKELKKRDILFIDSTHNVKIGNDVWKLYLNIIPKLKKGIIIHIHDINIEGEYDKEFVKRNRIFWNEQYLLECFLMFNKEFEIIYKGKEFVWIKRK